MSSFTAPRATRIARVVGHTAWWLFVVTQVMKDAPAATGLPSRYRAYTPLTDAGWTAYTPLTSSSSDFTDVNALATVSIVAILACVVAAVVEAFVDRRWLTGLFTVAAPIVGGALVVVGVESQYGGVWSDIWLRPMLAAGLVLLGVAVREIWARGFAPAAVAGRRS
ncbi:hypothetical protein [Gordonia phthalatica]|uniref:Uncharacterized protein n=1 Tax=Gordonia phthalatica TaxID=1136941 RepID=A0A0N9MQA0_9ACTN|nr:hypothetical protein [Gordonia phthalatica]ALG85009.1 hypothetical protein ACH46_11555 [Gordonia phthalatica]